MEKIVGEKNVFNAIDMDIIYKFKNASWNKKADAYIKNPKKLKELIEKCSTYTSKSGLTSVKDNLVLLINYVKDIAIGKYNDYNIINLVLIVAVLIFVVSPINIIPDFLPIGFVDDVAIIVWVINEMQSELDKYKQFHSLQN